MCRLFSMVGDAAQAEGPLLEFRDLADCGCVPAGLPSGHRDGWGIAAYRGKKIISLVRRPKDASRDPEYPAKLREVLAKRPEALLVHFRKASVGKVALANTAPYTEGQYALSHNGTIYGAERMPLSPVARKKLKGTTDTERLFQFILDGVRKGRAPRRAFIDAVRFVRAHLDYTAMALMFSDGKKLYVLRDVNTKNIFVKEKKLMGYYTLYEGVNREGARFFASEQLQGTGIRWRALKNKELAEIAIANGKGSVVKLA